MSNYVVEASKTPTSLGTEITVWENHKFFPVMAARTVDYDGTVDFVRTNGFSMNKNDAVIMLREMADKLEAA